MIDKIVLWLIKRLVYFWDRHEDKKAFCFARDEHSDYSILVARYREDGFSYGTDMHWYSEATDDG